MFSETVDDIYNPFGARLENGEWAGGYVSIEFLQKYFERCKTLDECIQATESEGLKLFFEHLKTTQ